MEITRRIVQYRVKSGWIERAYPIYNTRDATKLVCGEIKRLKLRYKTIHKNISSVYINVLIPRGDYILGIRISNHSKPRESVRYASIKLFQGYMVKVDINTYEGLEEFLNKFEKYAI